MEKLPRSFLLIGSVARLGPRSAGWLLPMLVVFVRLVLAEQAREQRRVELLGFLWPAWNLSGIEVGAWTAPPQRRKARDLKHL